MELIYDRWSGPIYGLALSICKEETMAQDVLQETFLKVWSVADKYDPSKAKLFTWIYQIARHKSIDALRSSKSKRIENIQSASSVVSSEDSGVLLAKNELTSHIAKLDPKYRAVLQSLYFEGMTQQEMSDETGIALGTIKSRLRIALRELRAIYQEPILIFMLIRMIYAG